MEEILSYLRSIYPLLSEECQEYLTLVAHRRDVKKGDLLLKPGEVCQHLYFIKRGLLRCYYFRGKKETTAWFFWEGGTVVSIKSWYTQTPGTQYIQALEDCELYAISYEGLEYAYHQFLEFNFVGRVLTARYHMIWEGLLETMRCRTALERYNSIMEHEPEILQRVLLRDVATWLGMTPEALSRARGQIAS